MHCVMVSSSEPQAVFSGFDATCFNGLSCLEWRTVMALGLSEADAKSVVKGLAMRQLAKPYRRHLLKAGLVDRDATGIANAIAYYDTFGQLSNAEQRELLNRYCVEICRAQLWRAELLTTPMM